MKLEEVKYYLEILEKHLADHLAWGAIGEWKYSNFTELSQRIEEQVGVRISYMTLIRIFQEKQFKRSPQIATLNALAQFLNYQGWEDFCHSFEQETSQSKGHIVEEPSQPSIEESQGQSSPLYLHEQKSRKQSWKKWLAISVIGMLGALSIYVFLGWNKPEAVEVSIIEQTSTFPNPIRVKYKVPSEGYFLLVRPLSAKSLAKKHKKSIPSGLLKIDLISTDSIYLLKTRLPIGSYEVLIAKNETFLGRATGLNLTRGWEGILQSDTRKTKSPSYRPVIFEPRKSVDGFLTVPEDIKSLVESTWLEKLYRANYFLAKDFSLNTNECQISLRCRQIALGSMREPALIRISLLTDDGMIEVPILSQSSDASATVWVSTDKIPETDPRLKLFQVEDAYEWQDVRLKVRDQIVHIYLNEKLVTSLPYTKPLGKLSCVRIKFQGLGEVDDFEILDGEDNQIFQDQFTAQTK